MTGIDAPELVGTIAGWGAAGIGLAGSVALLRRRLSRDKTEMVKDRVESGFVELLLKERDAANADWRDAWRVRQHDTEVIARLTSQNEHLIAEITRLRDEIGSFKRLVLRLHPDMRAFLVSSYPPLPDTPP